MLRLRCIFAAMVAVLTAAGAARALPANPPQAPDRMEPAPAALTGITIDEKSGEQVPLDLAFVDSTGRAVTLAEYFGKDRPVVLQLGYFDCPMLCGLVSQGLIDSLNDLTLTVGKEFELINLSFDPKETHQLAARKKQSFLDAYNRPAGAHSWHFLTGKQEQIDALTQAVGFQYKWIESSRQFSHPAALILLTPDGRVSRYLYGVKFEPRTFRLSLVEASEGKIGSTIDRILLTCFHYDSYAGKYNLAAMNLMRAAGVLTVIVVAGAILFALRREAARNRRAAALAAAETGKMQTC